MTWTAVLDILIAAFVIYQALVFIQGRRAMHMVVGVGLVVLSFYLARWTRLDTVSWLLSTVLPYFVFLIIIVFQSEIRRALAHFGQSAFPGSLSRINRSESTEEIILCVEKLASNQYLLVQSCAKEDRYDTDDASPREIYSLLVPESTMCAVQSSW